MSPNSEAVSPPLLLSIWSANQAAVASAAAKRLAIPKHEPDSAVRLLGIWPFGTPTSSRPPSILYPLGAAVHSEIDLLRVSRTLRKPGSLAARMCDQRPTRRATRTLPKPTYLDAPITDPGVVHSAFYDTEKMIEMRPGCFYLGCGSQAVAREVVTTPPTSPRKTPMRKMLSCVLSAAPASLSSQ